jgi:hypothetical protein
MAGRKVAKVIVNILLMDLDLMEELKHPLAVGSNYVT